MIICFLFLAIFSIKIVTIHSRRTCDINLLAIQGGFDERLSNKEPSQTKNNTRKKQRVCEEGSDGDYDSTVYTEEEKLPAKKRKVLRKASLDIVSKLSTGLIKMSRKSLKYGFDLLAGKHASLDQIIGKWKLTQDVEIKPGVIYSCPATFKLLRNGTIITSCNGKVYYTKYSFKERQWPQTCRIKFDAFAFQPPGEEEPINLLYSGYFKRSILNKKVLLIRGKVYQMTGKLWRSRKRLGKFKASQRRY